VITLALLGVETAVEQLGDALDREVAEALFRVCGIVAEDAAGAHAFVNRTGDLEASIRAEDPIGFFMSGSLVGKVVADTDYAQYVDGRAGFEFLQPAFDRTTTEHDRALQDALDEAARIAGW
jgi:hypothetical protein